MRLCPAIALSAALVGLPACTPASSDADAVHMSVFDMKIEKVRGGGFSAIDISADGRRFIAVTDDSYFIEGRITRHGGWIVGLEWSEITRLPRKLMPKDPLKEALDSEGITYLPKGGFAVSYEVSHDLRVYRTATDLPTTLPLPPDTEVLKPNGSFEALAADARGHLYILPERSGQLTEPLPVHRFDGTSWSTPYHIPRRGGFLPVGADILAGQLYVLEREFNGLAFRSRVRRFDMETDALGGESTLLATPWGRHGNLEGLAVWRDADDGLRFTMISDDNGLTFMRSEMVEYVIDEALANKGAGL